MIMIKDSGSRKWRIPAAALGWITLIAPSYAWQQEYIASETHSNVPERYTWDSESQPRYDDILAERINASLAEPGFAVASPDNPRASAMHTLSMAYNIPVSESVTTGPVMSWHYDASSPAYRSAFGDSLSTAAQNDPMWHASVSTVGWRINTQPLWGVQPWAQISYNQQFGENQWKSQSGLNRTPTSTQDGNWKDVTLGADMLLNPHLSAYASFSQTDNMSETDNYLYMMGMSARF